MEKPFARSLYGLGLVAMGLIVATCKGDMGNAGPAGGTGPTGPTGPVGPNAAFKNGTTTNLVSIAASGVTNVATFTFTAPAAGFVQAAATGYCNTATGTTAVQWAYILGATATESWTFPEPLSYYPSGSNIGQAPLVVERAFAVSAGANTIYLNVQNVTGSGLQSCGATITVWYTASQLP